MQQNVWTRSQLMQVRLNVLATPAERAGFLKVSIIISNDRSPGRSGLTLLSDYLDSGLYVTAERQVRTAH